MQRGGRLRDLLLTILNRFLADHGPERVARQKRFGCSLILVSTLIRNEERSFKPPDEQAIHNVYSGG